MDKREAIFTWLLILIGMFHVSALILGMFSAVFNSVVVLLWLALFVVIVASSSKREVQECTNQN